jgi:hypothetical protein
MVDETHRRRHPQLARGRVARLLQRLRRSARRFQQALAMRVVAFARFVERCSSVTLLCCSSARMVWLTAEGLMPSRRAAALIEPASTVSAKTASGFKSSIYKSCFKVIVVLTGLSGDCEAVTMATSSTCL